ncbi:hypothetical protein RA086_03700 [Lactiplantibacillus sp. WILCCON 0030]|uniref:Uncharacterized protein n=1 Tax=Lactiplantibacillus brownii TaxID=3069269 RepID=A0ABU1A7A6_9LACO|nr:hypothetical protein [Lactiplantibacillus brownii]MDQ7936751.1 hypothetical protein [Lactiplantibacillus brownii]
MNGQDRYEEQTAVQALVKRHPKKFASAYLPKEDMPDIQVNNASIGVEVVIGVKTNITRVLFMNKQPGKRQIDNPIEALRRMGIQFYHPNLEGSSMQPILPNAFWDSGNNIQVVIQSKVQKARKYTKLSENDLFIHVIDSKDEVVKTVEAISTISDMPFDYIYLWDGFDLIEIKTADGTSIVY